MSGAQKTKLAPRLRSWSLWSARVLLLTGLLLGVVYLPYLARTTPAAASIFQLEQVEYRGLKHLDAAHLDSLLGSELPRNLLAADLERVRRLVESESWVRRAWVRRRLPHSLLVRVEERRPEAVANIDGGLFLVDGEGVVLSEYGPGSPALDRPIVKGLRNVAMEDARRENALRMKVYLRVLGELKDPERDYTASLSEIDVRDPHRVAVIPEHDPVRIYLGQEHFLSRYQTFLSQKDLYEKLKRQHGPIESVDLTYEDRIIFHTPGGKGTSITRKGGRQS